MRDVLREPNTSQVWDFRCVKNTSNINFKISYIHDCNNYIYQHYSIGEKWQCLFGLTSPLSLKNDMMLIFSELIKDIIRNIITNFYRIWSKSRHFLVYERFFLLFSLEMTSSHKSTDIFPSTKSAKFHISAKTIKIDVFYDIFL